MSFGELLVAFGVLLVVFWSVFGGLLLGFLLAFGRLLVCVWLASDGFW